MKTCEKDGCDRPAHGTGSLCYTCERIVQQHVEDVLAAFARLLAAHAAFETWLKANGRDAP